jgi:hypothetical protein
MSKSGFCDTRTLVLGFAYASVSPYEKMPGPPYEKMPGFSDVETPGLLYSNSPGMPLMSKSGFCDIRTLVLGFAYASGSEMLGLFRKTAPTLPYDR